jgi:hypothetical protein
LHGILADLDDLDDLARELRERVPMDLLRRAPLRWDVDPAGTVWCADVGDVAGAVVEGSRPLGVTLSVAELLQTLGDATDPTLAPGGPRGRSGA